MVFHTAVGQLEKVIGTYVLAPRLGNFFENQRPPE